MFFQSEHLIPTSKLRSDARGTIVGGKNYKWAFGQAQLRKPKILVNPEKGASPLRAKSQRRGRNFRPTVG